MWVIIPLSAIDVGCTTLHWLHARVCFSFFRYCHCDFFSYFTFSFEKFLRRRWVSNTPHIMYLRNAVEAEQTEETKRKILITNSLILLSDLIALIGNYPFAQVQIQSFIHWFEISDKCSLSLTRRFAHCLSPWFASFIHRTVYAKASTKLCTKT